MFLLWGENSSSPKYLSTSAVVVLTLIGSGGEHVFLKRYIPFGPSSRDATVCSDIANLRSPSAGV